MYPVTGFAVEDIKASTHFKTRRWNRSFSPLETGKCWLYGELRKLGTLTLKASHETAELRKQFGEVKSEDKMLMSFSAHNVDSWVLAKDALGVNSGHSENRRLIHCRPLRFRRRALHLQNPAKRNVRRSHGGTVSEGFKRGSLVNHPTHGLVTVGGTKDGQVSLHNLSGKRLCQNAKPEDIKLLKRVSLIFQPIHKHGIPPPAKASGFLPKTL
jgi:hypothetical protein